MLGALALTAALGMAGCADDEAVASEAEAAAAEIEPGDTSPEALGRIGAELAEDPARTRAVLAQAGLTWEDYEEAVRAVAADVELARRYEQAYRAAGGDAASARPEA